MIEILIVGFIVLFAAGVVISNFASIIDKFNRRKKFVDKHSPKQK